MEERRKLNKQSQKEHMISSKGLWVGKKRRKTVPSAFDIVTSRDETKVYASEGGGGGMKFTAAGAGALYDAGTPDSVFAGAPKTAEGKSTGFTP